MWQEALYNCNLVFLISANYFRSYQLYELYDQSKNNMAVEWTIRTIRTREKSHAVPMTQLNVLPIV